MIYTIQHTTIRPLHTPTQLYDTNIHITHTHYHKTNTHTHTNLRLKTHTQPLYDYSHTKIHTALMRQHSNYQRTAYTCANTHTHTHVAFPHLSTHTHTKLNSHSCL